MTEPTIEELQQTIEQRDLALADAYAKIDAFVEKRDRRLTLLKNAKQKVDELNNIAVDDLSGLDVEIARRIIGLSGLIDVIISEAQE